MARAALRNFTRHNVTCACDHLTAFASNADKLAATATTAISMAGQLTLADILAVLGVIITILVLYGVFLFFWWYGRYHDDLDHKKRIE